MLVDSGLPCDTFNIVCCARLTRATAVSRIQAALAFFSSTGHPFSWWHGPSATPGQLGPLLAAAGLRSAETEHAMAATLAAQPDPPPRPSGLTVERVRTAAGLRGFASLCAANWTPPDLQVERYYGLAAPWLLREDSPQWLYLGTLDDRPVATAEVTVGGGVAGLYNIATHPALRRRGIGSAMTHEALKAARAAGHETAILQSAPSAAGMYARLGFVTFGRITEYKPSLPTSAV